MTRPILFLLVAALVALAVTDRGVDLDSVNLTAPDCAQPGARCYAGL